MTSVQTTEADTPVLAEQSRIAAQNPAEAARLKAAAGV